MATKASEVISTINTDRTGPSVAESMTHWTRSETERLFLADVANPATWYEQFRSVQFKKTNVATETPMRWQRLPPGLSSDRNKWLYYKPIRISSTGIIDRHVIGRKSTLRKWPAHCQFDSNIELLDFSRDVLIRLSSIESSTFPVLLSSLDTNTTALPNDKDESTSPFDDIAAKSSKTAATEIVEIATLARGDAKQMQDRLTSLLKYSQEDPDIRVMAPNSVRSFRKFLEANPKIKSPALFLDDSGAIRAQWIVDTAKALSILFHPSGVAEYVLFAPDRRRPSIPIDHAGSASWQSVMPSFFKIARLDWLFNA